MLKAKNSSERIVWISIAGFLLLLAAAIIVPCFFGLSDLGKQDYAISTMRGLISSEAYFAAQHPAKGYSCRLADISNNESASTGKPRNGYTFEILDCQSENAKGPQKKYRLIARPSNSKLPAFCSDETGVLRADYSGSVSNCISGGKPL